MEILKAYLESRFPTMNDIDRAHIDSLLKSIEAKASRESFNEGYLNGKAIGTIEGANQEKIDAQAID